MKHDSNVDEISAASAVATADPVAAAGDLAAEELLHELLVEEISIDGMCGVY